MGGVVHTLGMLLEDDNYKQAVREGDIPALLRSVFSGRNPLQAGAGYEIMNRDTGKSI